MEPRRFDALTTALAGVAPRRSVFKGVVGGGLAAAVAALGVRGFNPLDAEAAKTCKQKCQTKKSKKAKRRCKRRCKKGGSGGTTVAPKPISTNALGAGLGSSCTASNDCLLGLICDGGSCAACATACPAGSATTCCAVGICKVLGGQSVCLLNS